MNSVALRVFYPELLRVGSRALVYRDLEGLVRGASRFRRLMYLFGRCRERASGANVQWRRGKAVTRSLSIPSSPLQPSPASKSLSSFTLRVQPSGHLVHPNHLYLESTLDWYVVIYSAMHENLLTFTMPLPSS